jgi:hypothetical protein
VLDFEELVRSLEKQLVPEVGLEPTWDCSRQILSLVRIPISPLRLRTFDDTVSKDRGQGSIIGPLFSVLAFEFRFLVFGLVLILVFGLVGFEVLVSVLGFRL